MLSSFVWPRCEVCDVQLYSCQNSLKMKLSKAILNFIRGFPLTLRHLSAQLRDNLALRFQFSIMMRY
jgi:hypothetical protein